MISTLFSKIGITVATGLVALAGFFGYTPAPQLAGQYQTPDAIALFETSLASRITSSDTSFTLTSATDADGNTLASSTYGFIIDEGTAVEEMVLADCTSTACTNATRGLSVRTGTTTVSALKFEHRRGASVKITDAPSLIFAVNVFKGRQNIENKLRYDSAQTFTNATDIISRDYADALAFGAIPEAGYTAGGFAELATQTETASSTTDGSDAVLVIPAANATSTYNSATAGLRVVVTQNNGKIDNNFIATTTLFTNASLGTTTQIGAFNAWDGFFKQRQIITTTGTSTFAIPSGVNKLWVEVQAGGGGGGGCLTSGSGNEGAGGGGGGGGYAQEIVDVSATTSVQVYVGAGGIANVGSGAGNEGGRTTFGTMGFHFLSASGGSPGLIENSNGTGGTGGTGTGGDVNIPGGDGGNGAAAGTGDGRDRGGFGGSSFYAGNAQGGQLTGTAGATGKLYGGGGGGSSCSNEDLNNGDGTAGAQGIMIIRW